MNLRTDTPNAPLGAGRFHAPGSLDEALAGLLLRYRRGVAARYIGLREEDISTIRGGRMLVSPKIDGELWFLLLGESPALCAPNGRAVVGNVPLLEEVRSGVLPRAERGTIVAGELFVVGGQGRPRCGDVARTLHGGDPARLGFAAFDLVRIGAEGLPPEPYVDRHAELVRLFEGGKRAHVVKTETVASAEGVRGLYDSWVATGKAEGLVARADDGRTLKVKPLVTLDCAVIGYTERTEDPTQAGSLLLALLRADGTYQVVGSCGNMGSEDDRRAFVSRLSGAVVPSNFRRAASSGELFRLVRPEIVVEIGCSDLQSEDSEGREVQQWTLQLDEGWTTVAPAAGAALIHPVLSRIREDKRVEATDIRVSQLQERTFVQGLERSATAPTLPTSTVVRREVWVKETKGETAVRKLLVWRTGKETMDPEYPAWVVHFTDYSPGRKEPLQREVRLAPDEATANTIAEAMIVENVKRGWRAV